MAVSVFALRPVWSFLRLRSRVLGRQLAELGVVRLLLLGGLLALVLGNAWVLLVAHPGLQWLVPVLTGGSCLTQHRRRTDAAFLRTVAPHYRRLLAAEYAVQLLPPGLGLLVLGYWPAALTLLPLPLLVALAPPAAGGAGQRPRRSLFRSEAFEWVSGARQSRLGLLWVLGLLVGGAVPTEQRASVVAALLVAWTAVTAAFYAVPEPRSMLLLYAGSSRAFRRRKLGLGLLLYALTAAPLLYLLGTSAAGGGGAALLAAWGLMVVFMAVLAKYAFYPQPTLIRLTQGGVLAVALLPLINYAYAPLLAAVFGGLIWKSRQKLRTHWHD